MEDSCTLKFQIEKEFWIWKRIWYMHSCHELRRYNPVHVYLGYLFDMVVSGTENGFGRLPIFKKSNYRYRKFYRTFHRYYTRVNFSTIDHQYSGSSLLTIKLRGLFALVISRCAKCHKEKICTKKSPSTSRLVLKFFMDNPTSQPMH